MIYKFNKKIINTNSVDQAFSNSNYIGYILPDGSLYRCKNHNVSNIDTVLKLYLTILISNYDDKNKLLDKPIDNKLLLIVVNYLNNASYEKIVALSNFINNNNLFFSDIAVQLFGCHMITRFSKRIVTSEVDHSCFYDYLLHDYYIDNVDKIIYDEVKKEYHYYKDIHNNDELYEEIKRIKNDVKEEEIELFCKGK